MPNVGKRLLQSPGSAGWLQLSLEQKLKLLALAAARKRTGVLNPDSAAERQSRAQWIAKCREDLYSWDVEALKPLGFKPAAHHRLLIKYLEKVANGEITRLMITMPPGSSKSTYASHLFPVWLFENNPNLRIIGASHTISLALAFSAKIQEYITENPDVLTYRLRTEQKQHWTTTNGGSYLAAGVGTAIPGYRADVGIIDDPVRGREAADSATDRETVWRWYLGSFERRLVPGAAVIVILTRWHEDDLAGRLLTTYGDATNGGQWTVLSLPAEAEAGDLLGRAPGEWLWGDDDYGYGSDLPLIKASLEKAGATREWVSQFQQRPRPVDGSIFKVALIGEPLKTIPVGHMVRAWDLAATRDTGKRDPSWTRGVKLMRTELDRYVVMDVQSIRGTPDEVEHLILQTAFNDGKRVRIGLPQDPGQAGKSQAAYYIKKLAGYTVEISPETGDKATRAAPIASQCNIGNLDIMEDNAANRWNRAFKDELAAFPSGAHEDMVDALSRAFGMLLENRIPFILAPEVRQRMTGGARNRFGRVRL